MTLVETRTDARRALLGRLIDHAALFPPASMSMADALAEDRRVRRADTGWLVGRFVCPASKLVELGTEPLKLSVVLDTPELAADGRIAALEVPPGRDPPLASDAPEVYVELPLDDALSERIAELGALGLRAKVRCGGARTPAVGALAAFVRGCRAAGVPFKATAGLHHAVRHGESHGFLNVLAAAVFGVEERALADTDASAFALDDRSFRWRDRSAEARDVARVRSEGFVGFGSCSVREPVEELRALGMLAA